jgi:peptidoglycan/LPS O-acetylase OafA/YrhL
MRVVLVLGGATSLWPYWGNTLARMDPIAAGALVALLLNGRLPKLANAMRVTMLIAGMLLLVACGMFLPKAGPPALVAYPLAMLAALLLLLGFLGAPWSYPKGLEYLGRISYGLYVFHILALRLAHTYVRAEFPVAVLFSLRFLTALLLTLAMAAISFRWLEMPFLRLKDRFAIIQSH